MVVGDVVMVTIDVKCRRKNRLKQKNIFKCDNNVYYCVSYSSMAHS